MYFLRLWIAIHNILFGQLGTLAFTMHEMGLKKPYVSVFVIIFFLVYPMQHVVPLIYSVTLIFFLFIILFFLLYFFSHELTQVQKLVMNLGKSSQLGDDLQIELFKSIKYVFLHTFVNDCDHLCLFVRCIYDVLSSLTLLLCIFRCISMSFKDETENSDLKKSKVNATAASRILSSSQDTANPLPVTATSSGSVDSQKPQAVVHATTTVLNEYIQDHPHMHPMLGKSKGQDVKGLL